MTPSVAKTEQAAHLTARGWTRTSAAGTQTWRDPEQTGSWTLAAAVREVARREQVS